ncbi:MAG: hypothetical protein J7L15_04935, partial [Clostridiales bacterium]|nr:hypothetical protein [Clostridiales bacterium]
ILRVNRTKTYNILPAIINFDIERLKSDIVYLTWKNPKLDHFDYNEITVTISDLTVFNGEDEIYVENLKIGKSDSFSVPSSYFSVTNRYNVEITTVDVFGDDGKSFEYSKNFTDEEEFPVPDSPSNILANSEDGSVSLSWNASVSFDMQSYNIYRAPYSTYIKSVDFLLIASIPSIYNSFIDYETINNSTYAYIVTSLNEYGNESYNPTDSDEYLVSSFVIAKPTQSKSMSPPDNLIVSLSGTLDVLLTWTVSAGAFDGYEIYRSIGNKYSFHLIGSAYPSVVTYLDKDVLLEHGQTYYYMVRTHKDEAILFVTESTIPPSSSVLIGKITSYMDGLTPAYIPDDTGVVDLLNFEDPIISMTSEVINEHKHIYTGDIDKRIELRSSSIVQDWTTLDYRTYQTVSDIEGASDYIVKVVATVNEDYFITNSGGVEVKNIIAIQQAQSGIPPFISEVDSENGSVIFSDYLFTTCIEPDTTNPDVRICPIVPYLTEPVISLELVDISEVDNTLPANKVESLSAVQVDSGLFNSAQMPVIKHEGRIREKLIPLKLPMTTLDNFVYSLDRDYVDDYNNKMGTSVSFYDIIGVDNDKSLLAATSSGIWYSLEYGNDWISKSSFEDAVHMVFKSSLGDYYAFTNYNAYKNTDTRFVTWEKMGGLDFVKVIRDITEDGNGNIYISTDLGVFRLNKDKPYIEDTWEQLSIFGVKSSEAYGILFDREISDPSISSTDGRIIVSNDLGILISYNEGVSWSYASDLLDSIKIFNFLKIGNSIFALSNRELYRQDIGETDFTKIANIDNVVVSRKIIEKDGYLYISTNDGPKISIGNIYGSSVTFVDEFIGMNIRRHRGIATSLNKINNIIFIGSNRKLYLYDGEKVWLQYEQFNTVLPTFYVDDIEQKLGFYYNNSGVYHNVSFDEVLLLKNKVSVSNYYNIYIAENKGWVISNYQAKFILRKNNFIWAEGEDKDDIDLTILDITLPNFEIQDREEDIPNFPELAEFNDINANEDTAVEYKTEIESNLVL